MTPGILILGANGMLGHALADAFAEEQPTLWDVGDLDITDRDRVRDRIFEEKFTTVINAAAYTAVDDAETHEALAMRINGDAVGNVVDACNETGARLIHISTDYVFPGDTAEGYAEDAATQPLNSYGRSKHAGERHILDRADSYCLVRTAWLYGLHGKNFVDTMLRLGNEQAEVRVVNDQTGSPTYTRDLATALRMLVTDAVPNGVYHLTNTGTCTWYEFTQEIFRQASLTTRVLPVTTDAFPRPARRPRYSVLVNTKRPALPTWQDGLARYMNECKMKVIQNDE